VRTRNAARQVDSRSSQGHFARFRTDAPFPEYNNNGLGMELNRAGTPRQRAARYRQRAEKLCQMAKTEPVEKIRTVLRETAAQYQKLADP
jgi:hypothetical protein